MIIAGVADTHTALWHLFDDARLSTAVRAFFDEAAVAHERIALSSISLVEIVYLAEKGRLPSSVYRDVKQALVNPNNVLIEAPLSAAVADAMQTVSRADIPDMPDRIVAATAVHLRVPILSRDGRIRASGLHTIW